MVGSYKGYRFVEDADDFHDEVEDGDHPESPHSQSFSQYHSGYQYYRHHKPRRFVDPSVLRRGFLLLHFQFILRADLPLRLFPDREAPPDQNSERVAQLMPNERRLAEVLRSSDALVPWELVHAVIVRVAVDGYECPICLEPPIVARITECGHVFCLPCLLHFIHEAKLSDKPRTCPVCHAGLSAHMLRPAILQSVTGLNAFTCGASPANGRRSEVQFDLFRRERGSCVLRRFDDPFHIYADAERERRLALGSSSRLLQQNRNSQSAGAGGNGNSGNGGTMLPNRAVEVPPLEGFEYELRLPYVLDQWGSQSRYLYSTDTFEAQHCRLDIRALEERLEAVRREEERSTANASAMMSCRSASACSPDSTRLPYSHSHFLSHSQPTSTLLSPEQLESPGEEIFLRAALAEVMKKAAGAGSTNHPANHLNGSQNAGGAGRVPAPQVGPARLPPPAASTATGAAAYVELYAESQGLPYFLHMINVKMLRYDAMLRHQTSLPSSIKAPVLEIQTLEQTEETRKIYKAFAHVPLHSTIQLCVLDLHHVVLPQTRKHFDSQLKAMAKQRRERHRQGKGADEADRQWKDYVARHQQPASQRTIGGALATPPHQSPSVSPLLTAEGARPVPSEYELQYPPLGATTAYSMSSCSSSARIHGESSAQLTPHSFFLPQSTVDPLGGVPSDGFQLPISVAEDERRRLADEEHNLPPNPLETRQRATKASSAPLSTASLQKHTQNCWARGNSRSILFASSTASAAPESDTWLARLRGGGAWGKEVPPSTPPTTRVVAGQVNVTMNKSNHRGSVPSDWLEGDRLRSAGLLGDLAVSAGASGAAVRRSMEIEDERGSSVEATRGKRGGEALDASSTAAGGNTHLGKRRGGEPVGKRRKQRARRR